jgi:O-methyltransferase
VIALMRAVLDATADANRRVWACDSFQGLPEPDVENYPADAASSIEGLLDGFISHQIAVSLDQVRSNIDRYQLLDDRIEFLEGWFKDTLPTAPIDQIALLRLDGDLYESTMDALTALEPKVSDGGYIIVDDYLSWDPCRQAVEDYREAHGIVAAIHQIDWTGVWWQKGASA